MCIRDRGKAVQIDPMTPALKLPGTKHLKPTWDELLSTFAFKTNLRRYIEGECHLHAEDSVKSVSRMEVKVRRCSLIL